MPGLVEATVARGDGRGELKEGGVRSKLHVTCRVCVSANGEFPGLKNRKSVVTPGCLAASNAQWMSNLPSVSGAIAVSGSPTGEKADAPRTVTASVRSKRAEPATAKPAAWTQ